MHCSRIPDLPEAQGSRCHHDVLQAQLCSATGQPSPASGAPMTSLSPACLLSFLMLMRYTLQQQQQDMS
jgi:hypothetical protein